MADDQDLNIIQVAGNMYLYERPELLNEDKHGHLGISDVPGPFKFASKARAVPLVVSEVITAQKHYPIVFSAMEDPMLLAVLGLFDGQKLFVNDDGEWEENVYIPAYLRCHPFAFAEGPDDKFAVVIDRAAPTVTESPDEPFFEDGKLSAATQARMDFFGQYGGERLKTAEFCKRMVEFELLSGQEVKRTVRGEKQNLAGYVAVDARKLENLDAQQLWELHRSGLLAVIYGHIFSLDNWNSLIQRHRRRLER